MNNLLFVILSLLLTACSLRPDKVATYTTKAPNRNIKVIYEQRVPNAFGGEENVYAQLADSRRVRISINGRFSEFLHVSISNDGKWYRIYLKDMHQLEGHVEYRDFDNDGELERLWISKNEDPENARSHPYTILAFVNASAGKVYRNNRELGFNTTPKRDYFGSKSELKSTQNILGRSIIWQPMNREPSGRN